MKGKLLLLPNLLDKEAVYDDFVPKSVAQAVFDLDGLIVESEKEGRAFLKRFSFSRERTFRDIPLVLFNKHHQEVDLVLKPLQEGQTWGLISDTGLPILADPGALLVRRSKDLAIEVKTFVGPTSLIYGLMLSGLFAQRFSFNGYLDKEVVLHIQKLEKRSLQEGGSTQIFIEAPYRNDPTFELAINSLQEQTLFCIAVDLTSKTELVETYRIGQWKKRHPPKLKGREVLFLFQAEASRG